MIDWGTSGLDVNHSALAQELRIFFAFSDDLDFSEISLNASKTKRVLDKALTASSPHSSSSINPIKGSTL